ncbi:hypothetical protein NLI96_g11012 [Meripilus lineatus]|uniref:Uncharacterized protein n=1 Tax=Meripilus lineatus TaxID=2056292 RepID=A0AAD5YDP0_9APHY|nr:hypothetical protein NLI96_g11012 [Physisporinus lineatus]
MFDDLHANKRSLHQRRGAGFKKLHARFSPTYVWSETGDTAVLTPSNTAPAPANTSPAQQQPSQQPVVSTPATIPSTTPAVADPVTTPTPQVSTPAANTTPSETPSASATPTPAASSETPNTAQTSAASAPAAETPVVATTLVAASASNPTLSRSLSSPTLSRASVVSGAGAIASASGTSEPSTTSVSTGAVIGGVVAGIAALAGIIFFVSWLMKRNRRNEDEFSAEAFKRQSVILPEMDGPRGGSGMDRSWENSAPQTPMFEQRMPGPPPPNMFEQRFAGPPPSQPWNGYQAQGSPSFAPGQYVTMHDTGRRDFEQDLSLQTPNSAQPFFAPMGQSPIGSPVSVAPYGSVYDNQPSPVQRQNSLGPNAYLSRQPSSNNGTLEPPEAHYVDLNRSSVTPFQAQQYEEISRRLNAPPPTSFSTLPEKPLPLAEEHVEPVVAHSGVSVDDHAITTDEPQDYGKSPFADPEGQDTPLATPRALPDFDDDDASITGFPVPPSPAFSTSTRITSTPPVLPEIQSQRGFSPVSMEFPLIPNSRATPIPSPLASSYTLPTTPASAHIADKPIQQPAASAPIPLNVEPATNSTRPQREAASARPDTVYTMYDDEDAYGGI